MVIVEQEPTIPPQFFFVNTLLKKRKQVIEILMNFLLSYLDKIRTA